MIEESTCLGDCTFTYNSSENSPSLVYGETLDYSNGEEITIHGTGFSTSNGINLEIED